MMLVPSGSLESSPSSKHPDKRHEMREFTRSSLVKSSCKVCSRSGNSSGCFERLILNMKAV